MIDSVVNIEWRQRPAILDAKTLQTVAIQAIIFVF
jgi:hypothetical protein